MISPTRAISPCADLAPVPTAGALSPPDQIGTWTHISLGLGLAVWDAANRSKDRQDEALDAMRVSNGMTLDQFLESAR